MPDDYCLILNTVEKSERGRTGATVPTLSFLLLFNGCCPAIFQGIPANLTKHRTNSLTIVMTILTFTH